MPLVSRWGEFHATRFGAEKLGKEALIGTDKMRSPTTLGAVMHTVALVRNDESYVGLMEGKVDFRSFI